MGELPRGGDVYRCSQCGSVIQVVTAPYYGEPGAPVSDEDRVRTEFICHDLQMERVE